MVQGQMILRLQEYGASVLRSMQPDDVRVSASTQLIFADGSQSTIGRSFAESAGDWLYIFSLTDGYFLFHKSDVVKWTPQSTPSRTVLTHEAVARGTTMQAA